MVSRFHVGSQPTTWTRLSTTMTSDSSSADTKRQHQSVYRSDGHLEVPSTPELDSTSESKENRILPDDERTDDPNEYPQGFALTMIMVALVTSLFLVSLDQVRHLPDPLTTSDRCFLTRLTSIRPSLPPQSPRSPTPFTAWTTWRGMARPSSWRWEASSRPGGRRTDTSPSRRPFCSPSWSCRCCWWWWMRGNGFLLQTGCAFFAFSCSYGSVVFLGETVAA